MMGSGQRGSLLTRRAVVTTSASAAGVLSAAALAACGPQAPAGGGAGGEGGGLAKQKPVSLEFWGGPPDAGQRNGRMDQIDFWNNKNPNFPVTFAMGQDQNTVGQGVTAKKSQFTRTIEMI